MTINLTYFQQSSEYGPQNPKRNKNDKVQHQILEWSENMLQKYAMLEDNKEKQKINLGQENKNHGLAEQVGSWT